MNAFDELPSIPPQLLADGYLARAVHGEHLTLAVLEVAPDAMLPEHQHPNEQFGMVIEGSVIFRVGDEMQTITPGGIWRIPPERPHTVTGGPKRRGRCGHLFPTPRRLDFRGTTEPVRSPVAEALTR